MSTPFPAVTLVYVLPDEASFLISFHHTEQFITVLFRSFASSYTLVEFMEAIIYVFTHLRFISKLQVHEFNLDDR